MTKFLYKIIVLFLLVSLFQCSSIKEIPKPEGSYQLLINSLKISKTSDVDTLYYTIYPNDGKKLIIVIDSINNSYSGNSFANVAMLKQTDSYVLLKRPTNFNNNNLKVLALAYGSIQSTQEIPYLNGVINNGGGGSNNNFSEKILFHTSNEWVIWDLKNNKKLYSTTSNLNIVDYNNQTEKILVLNGSYLEFYNENFTQSTITDYNSYYLNYAKNIRFSGSGNDVSFIESSFNYGRNFDLQGTLNTNYYYTYDYNSNDTRTIYADVVYNSNTGYYNLNYIKNGSSKLIETSYYISDLTNYNPVEISKDGKYVLYNYGSNLILYNTTNSTKKTIHNYNYNYASLNSSSSKICYIDNYNKLLLYDINSNSTSYPLQNTSYSSSSIYNVFW